MDGEWTGSWRQDGPVALIFLLQARLESQESLQCSFEGLCAGTYSGDILMAPLGTGCDLEGLGIK